MSMTSIIREHLHSPVSSTLVQAHQSGSGQPLGMGRYSCCGGSWYPQVQLRAPRACTRLDVRTARGDGGEA
jgi:hypothetical protein